MSEESLRLKELHAYNILDTLTEKDYEEITALASHICDVPMALISFVDADRQWFKAAEGLSVRETPIEQSFCAHAIKDPGEIMIVEDSRKDDRFKDNPLVTGDPNIVFYAGVPLVNPNGFSLGTVCVLDNKVRTLSEKQLESLKSLSNQVLRLLELRRINNTLQVLQAQLVTRNRDLEQFAMVVCHDIKSPLSSVMLGIDMLKNSFGLQLGEEGGKLLKLTQNGADKINSLTEGILSYYQGGEAKNEYETISLQPYFDTLGSAITVPKKFELDYLGDAMEIVFNRTQLDQIFFNLISNSVRYNDRDIPSITVTINEAAGMYIFTYNDNGIGISEENIDRVFDLFTTASAEDQFGLSGSGIGLPTVKKIIENAGGEISLQSEVGRGSEFTFSIKKRFT